MKDILEVLFKVVTLILIPLFIVEYAAYGIRVWAWNFVHNSCLDGQWTVKIRTEVKS